MSRGAFGGRYWHVRKRLEGAVWLRGVEVGDRAMVWGKPQIEVSDLRIGDDLLLHSAHRRVRIAGGGKVRIGNRVGINHGVTITAQQSVEIGDDVGFAEDVFVMDSGGHGIEGGGLEAKPVVIGSGTWIGLRAVILPGVTVGSRCVIGAGSIVTKDVPPETVVAGNPARVLRTLSYPDSVVRAWNGSW